jgi:hypothetical protein
MVRIVAETAENAGEALERVISLARGREPRGEWIHFAGGRAYLKAEPLFGRARMRHTLRALLLRRPLPRLAEYGNLLWLRKNGFQAPEPLAAGSLLSRGAPRWQFLVSREVPLAPTLRSFLDAGKEDPAAILDELADEVARMHASRFVHRDLFPRNILIQAPTLERRVVFLDCWRGGARLQLRGPAYDLGCFFLHAHEWLTTETQRSFLERYVAGRTAHGRPIETAALLRSVTAERSALRARLKRSPHRLRGRPLPPEAWL